MIEVGGGGEVGKGMGEEEGEETMVRLLNNLSKFF